MLNEQEWLETNGTGGFACGTVSGEIRRRWHGLLWAARKPPRERVRLLVGLEEYLHLPDVVVTLSSTWANRRWNLPTGWADFDPFPIPHWKWELHGGAVLHKELFMPDGTTDVLYIRYRLEPSAQIQKLILSIRPITCSPGIGAEHTGEEHPLSNGPGRELYLYGSKSLSFMRRGETLHDVVLETEKDCEEEWTETLYAQPALGFSVTGKEPIDIVFSGRRLSGLPRIQTLRDREARRRSGLKVRGLSRDVQHLAAPLAHAADQFITHNPETKATTIMAGYPWFSDWGRDAMIAVPALCLSTGNVADAKEIIRHFLSYVDKGLIPNLFPEKGEEPMYNTVDATLWLVETTFRVFSVAEIIGDEHIWAKMQQIVRSHIRGTHNGIHVAKDGLLAAGTEGTQLTWMDVKVNGEVPTPRHGKAVEIQGLWYNALKLIEGAAQAAGDGALRKECSDYAVKAASAFAERFFDPALDYPADVVDRDGEGTADFTLRPNFVIPFGLANNIIPAKRRAELLRVISRDFLTARGLRTLTPSHPKYRGIYAGPVLERDRAYHQGTVWMWLLGPYVKGLIAEKRHVPELIDQVRELAREMAINFESEGCLHQCNEIFDGDLPHTPRGCFAQAWSVAALIEVLQAIKLDVKVSAK